MKSLSKYSFIFLLILITCPVRNNAQTNFIWGKQFGTDKEEVALNAVPGGHGSVYISGYTDGNLSGNNLGGSDGFLTKLDSAGLITWSKQIGTNEEDKINSMAIDKNENIYLTGYTKGTVGEKNFGKEDIFIVKVSLSGSIIWQKQFGTDSADIGSSVFVNEKGDVYIAGSTRGILGSKLIGSSDCFILKLDTDGNKLAVNQFGSPLDDDCNGITEGSDGNIFVCGDTWGSLEGSNLGKIDGFIGIFSASLETNRFIQFGTNDYDNALCIKTDKQKNIYVGGSTLGEFGGKQQGQGDSYMCKFNDKGELVWKKQFGTALWDGVLGIDLNENISDNIIVSGCQNWPSCQSFCRMFTKNGEQLWVRNHIASGKSGGTCGKGVCLDKDGNFYHTGMTGGNLFNNLAGGHDIFVLKYALDKE